MTVQRSSSGKAAASWLVVSGRSRSSSQMRRRTGLASALNTASRSSSVDMLCFYNIIERDSRRQIMDLKFRVFVHIAKAVHDGFEAVADPAQLSHYFTTGGAQGRLETGATVTWDFADFPGAFPVHVVEVVRDERIVLEWGGDAAVAVDERDGTHTTVTMTFEPTDDDRTLVSITEEGWQET